MEYFYTGKYKYARRVPYQNIKLLFTNDLKSRKNKKKKKIPIANLLFISNHQRQLAVQVSEYKKQEGIALLNSDLGCAMT